MLIDKIKSNGKDVHIINNGGSMIFWNAFYGFIAYATMDKFDCENNKAKYTVYVGNHNTLGSSFGDSVITTSVKRYINKMMNKYISTTVSFDIIKGNDLAFATLACDFNFKNNKY